jgi:hypothetical protein
MVEADASDVLAWRALVQVLAQQERVEEVLPKHHVHARSGEAPHGPLRAPRPGARDARPAEAALRTFVSRSESPAAVIPLVELHSARGDAEAARAVLDEALERHPDEPRCACCAPRLC